MLNIVLGDGTMPATELRTALQDLWNKDKDDSFWFIVQGKPEPTDTDKTMVKWFDSHEIYYSIVSNGDHDANVYANAQDVHQTKRLTPTIVKLLQEAPEENESAQILALFASDDFSAEEDRWLNDAGKAAQEAGFITLALNDGCMEMDMSDSEEEAAEPEPEAEPAKPAKKAAAKKAAAKKLAAAPAAEEEEETPADPGRMLYTREELEEMALDQLKEIAAARGIELPARSRMSTYVKALLGELEEEGPPEVEIDGEAVASWSDEADEPLPVDWTDASPALLVVHFNGSVVSRAITPEQALDLIGASVSE